MHQRAKECSQALDLILGIDRGRPVKNALDVEFDMEQLKVSFKKVISIFQLFIFPYHMLFWCKAWDNMTKGCEFVKKVYVKYSSNEECSRLNYRWNCPQSALSYKNSHFCGSTQDLQVRVIISWMAPAYCWAGSWNGSQVLSRTWRTCTKTQECVCGGRRAGKRGD